LEQEEYERRRKVQDEQKRAKIARDSAERNKILTDQIEAKKVNVSIEKTFSCDCSISNRIVSSLFSFWDNLIFAFLPSMKITFYIWGMLSDLI